METYPLVTPSGLVEAFEISVLSAGLRRMARILQTVPGVCEVRVRTPFSRSQELITFKLADTSCLVCDPFGDNSRYWIGPLSDSDFGVTDMRAVAEAFDRVPASRARAWLARISAR